MRTTLKTRRRSPSGAFTLTEILVTSAIMAIIMGGILAGAVQLARSVGQSRNYNFTKQKLSSFVQGIYSFFNRSKGAYFLNSSTEIDFLASYPSLIAKGDPRWDTVYLVKDAANNTGSLTYSPTARTISWMRTTGVAAEVMLTDVYRSDYVNDSSPGIEPVFRFPHRPDLYISATRPSYIIVEFQRRVAPPTSTNPNPVHIPIKLIYKLNTT